MTSREIQIFYLEAAVVFLYKLGCLLYFLGSKLEVIRFLFKYSINTNLIST